MRWNILASLAGAGAVFAAPTATAQEAEKTQKAAEATQDKRDKGFAFSPKLLDSGDTGSATLAIEYWLDRDLFTRNLDSNDAGTDHFKIEGTRVGDISLAAKGQGTIASSADRNPENLIDMRLSLDAAYSSSARSNAKVGIFVKYESDQSFKDDNAVFGAHATWVGFDLFSRGSWMALDGGYGKVDPGDDDSRKTALGVTELESYDRLEFEAVYKMSLNWSVIDELELNYRLYTEINAPAAIKAADLDVHQLGTVRVGLPGAFFIGYRVGKLPFDRKDNHTLEAGLSYKLFK